MVQIAAARGTANHRDKKRRILKAASRVFRRRGLHATGMREIAAEMGMHAGNLYYYFRSKEELLAYCQEETLRQLLELAESVRATGSPADEALRRLISGHLICLNETNPGSLAHLEVEALGDAWRERIRAQRDRYEAHLRDLVDAGVRAGVFRPVDPKLASLAILGALNWTVKWFRSEGVRSASEMGAAFADLLLDGLRRSPGEGAA